MWCSFDAVNVETFTVFLGNRLRDRGELAPRKANGKRRYAQHWPCQEWPGHAARLAAMSSAALGDEGPPEGQIGSPQRKLYLTYSPVSEKDFRWWRSFPPVSTSSRCDRT